MVQKELVVVLMARTVDDLRTRAARDLPRDIIEQERQDYRRRMNDFNTGAGDRTNFPDPADPIRVQGDRPDAAPSTLTPRGGGGQ